MGSESEEIQAGGMYNEATSVEEARNINLKMKEVQENRKVRRVGEEGERWACSSESMLMMKWDEVTKWYRRSVALQNKE